MLGSQVHVIHARISAQQGVDPQQLAKVAQDVKQALNESNDIAAIGKNSQPKTLRSKVQTWDTVILPTCLPN